MIPIGTFAVLMVFLMLGWWARGHHDRRAAELERDGAWARGYKYGVGQ